MIFPTCFMVTSQSILVRGNMEDYFTDKLSSFAPNSTELDDIDDSIELSPYGVLWFEIWFAVSMLICITSTTLFLLLLRIIAQRKDFQTGSSILIIHLIIQECIICGLCSPLQTVSMFINFHQHKATHTGIHCPTYLLLYITTIHANSWLAVFLAFNRYVAVLYPLKYKWWIRKNLLRAMIVTRYRTNEYKGRNRIQCSQQPYTYELAHHGRSVRIEPWF
ncbi:hypothetical protein RvY_11875-2 [Ramazzottius varieornatus]|uniref:G-protein coupled receptors family 1 profile domain-containing protein n=1 Tax=Ramazzottius varieornatus TaxID=947166 RepID=A0A1D1VQ90_RAMVA|nr:hypothetical protein RvY_11875-2 [Ramazzottius varieornatus]